MEGATIESLFKDIGTGTLGWFKGNNMDLWISFWMTRGWMDLTLASSDVRMVRVNGQSVGRRWEYRRVSDLSGLDYGRPGVRAQRRRMPIHLILLYRVEKVGRLRFQCRFRLGGFWVS
jgi:hypothetical protein